MENVIFVKKYTGNDEAFSINKKEVFRYAGYFGRDYSEDDLIEEVLWEVTQNCKNALSYRVCYRELDLEWDNGLPKLPFETNSKNLAKCLEGSCKVVIFAATIGLEIDRLIARYQRVSPTKALLLQAYGAERVEKLCDVFCIEYENNVAADGLFCTPRYSPGYGDLPLAVQKDVFNLLECEVKVGISLNSSLLMTPSKSVTAIFGLRRNYQTTYNKCEICGKKDCFYKSAVKE